MERAGNQNPADSAGKALFFLLKPIEDMGKNNSARHEFTPRNNTK